MSDWPALPAVMDPPTRRMLSADAVVALVATRLEQAGALVELDHLRGFSAYEVDVLVRLERGWGATSTSAVPSVHTQPFQVVHGLGNAGCTSGCSQGTGAVVAA